MNEQTATEPSTVATLISETKLKRGKSITQSIRARLSRSYSSDSNRLSAASTADSSIGTIDAPPVPVLPRSYSANAVSRLHPDPPSPLDHAQIAQAWTSIDPPAFPSGAAYTACCCEENIYLLAADLSAQLSAINRAAVNIAHRQSRRGGAVGGNVFVPVWDLHVVFISNATRTVLLYQQAASRLTKAGWPVIWDYHVVAMASCHLIPLSELHLGNGGFFKHSQSFAEDGQHWCKSWVYDFDSRLSLPTSSPSTKEGGRRVVQWDEYHRSTFPTNGSVPEHFRPVFRSVPANDFLAHFASDRSHMLVSSPSTGVAPQWSSEPPKWGLIVGSEAKKLGVVNNLMERYVHVGEDLDVGEIEHGYGVVWDGTTWLSSGHVPRQTGKLGSSISGTDTASERKRPSGSVTGGLAGQAPAAPACITRPTAQDALGEKHSSSSSSVAPTANEGEREKRPKGGRIASPLFPAYLHASQQHRSQLPPPSTPAVTGSSLHTPL